MADFNWRPGIGDPTVGGWITVVLYFATVISCWLTARRVDGGSSDKKIWRLIAMLFLALGINKQLDLQTALTEIGRIVAFSEGWYERRRGVQLEFVVAVAVCAFIVIAGLLISARRSKPPTWLALTGVTLVIAFVVIRAASFHHIDEFIGTSILGLRWNWILEMGGIGIVLVASFWRRRSV